MSYLSKYYSLDKATPQYLFMCRINEETDVNAICSVKYIVHIFPFSKGEYIHFPPNFYIYHGLTNVHRSLYMCGMFVWLSVQQISWLTTWMYLHRGVNISTELLGRRTSSVFSERLTAQSWLYEDSCVCDEEGGTLSCIHTE